MLGSNLIHASKRATVNHSMLSLYSIVLARYDYYLLYVSMAHIPLIAIQWCVRERNNINHLGESLRFSMTVKIFMWCWKIVTHSPVWSLVVDHFPHKRLSGSLYIQYSRFYLQSWTFALTKPQNLIDSRLVFQLSLLNPLKPGIKSRMKI